MNMDNNNNLLSHINHHHHNHHISSSSSSSTSSSSNTINNHQQQHFWLMNNNNNLSLHSFNLNDEENKNKIEEEEEEEMDESDKEAMFEKPLTPSDVGKLNRLVIPKQHAERYFPLAADAAAEKGLLLSFEDDSGKPWRFRYSYWNSSQSYVLTKGWSRFVKENRLDAGDVVLFMRHRSQSDRLFIASRRRDSQPNNNNNNNNSYPHSHSQNLHYHHQQSHSIIHSGLLSSAHHQSQTTTIGNSNNTNNNDNNNTNNSKSSKIVRLFGVNLECHDNQDESSEPSTPDGSSLSSQDLQQFYPHQPYYSSPLHNHMDFTFSRDVKTMRDRRG